MHSTLNYQPSYPSTSISSQVMQSPSHHFSQPDQQITRIPFRQSQNPPPYSESDLRIRTHGGFPAEYAPSSSVPRRSPMNTHYHLQNRPQYLANNDSDFLGTQPFTERNQTSLPYPDGKLRYELQDLSIKDSSDQSIRSEYAPVNATRSTSQYLSYPHHEQSHQTHQVSPPTRYNDFDSLSYEQQIFDRTPASCNEAASPPFNIPILSRAIAIPQTSPGGGHAFARAWVPSLSSHGITPSEFLAFIDGLNIVSTANPPLQVLNLAGGIIGMVPYHWAAIAGFAIQATATLGTVAVSKGRTEMYMNEANKKFFAPRNLKVVIASLDAVRSVLRIPDSMPILAPLTRDTISTGIVDRSLAVMSGYAAELDFNVPPPAEQTSMLDKMSAKQVERQGKRSDKKMLKERSKILEKQEKEDAKKLEREEKHRGRRHRDSDSDSDNAEERAEKTRKELKKERSRERKERRKAENDSRKGKDKEVEKAKKLLWVLIQNL